ncbi:MAG: carbohydrate ABC transporter permease [Lachnospiraceae bacterium]|nr:carbohydrate ABC transporter permease [Lachnospiraceae bacterium]
MMTAATNNTADVARGKMFFGTEAATNFTNLVKETNLWQGMGNSFKYAAIQTILCLIVCSLAGYGFELYHDEKKDLLFGILLMGMMIPGVATMIPLFSMMSHLHLLNTSAGFVLPAVSTPFMIMMFRQNSRNFPVDIFEAARIDGLSEFAIFYKMYMPIMKATYAAAAVIIFMNAWNSYLWPRVVMTENKAQTMPILIANMANGYSVDYGKLMMGVLFSTIPTLVIFFVLQKRFTEGITGAVK